MPAFTKRQYQKRTFRFPAVRRLAPKPLAARAEVLRTDPPVMLIHGLPVGSKEEYYVGTALDILGWEYNYQYPVDFGRQRRGGQVLDFLVHTPVKWTVVDVRGVYWHTGRREDSLSILRVARRHSWSLVVAWDYNVPSVALAVSFLRFQLG